MSSSAQSRVQVTISAIDRLTEPLRRITSGVQRLTQPLQRVRDLAGRIGRATGLEGIGRAAEAATRRVRALNDRLLDTQRRNRQALTESRGQIMEGVGWGAAAYSALRPAVAFEDAIARVGAVANATDDELARLADSARQIGRAAPVSASDAAEAMQYLGMAGFDANAILAATPDLVNLSVAGGTDIARTADIASNILSAFRLEATDMGRVADVIASTVSSANVSVVQLGEAMAYAAPNAAAAGVSIEELAAMVGILGDIGIQGSRGGTAMTAMMTRLSSPTGGAIAALADLGVVAVDAEGNLRPMHSILGELADAVDHMGGAARAAALSQIFGQEPLAAVQGLLTAAQDGSLSASIAARQAAEGANQALADRMNATTGGALQRLSSAAEDVAITIGDIFLPALADIADRAAAAANWISALAERHPTLTRMVGYAAGGLVALRMAMIAVNVASLVVQGGLIGAALGATRLASVLAMMLSPVGLVIGAVAALAAGAYLVYRNWDSVSAWLGSVWTWIAETATAAFTAIMDFLTRWNPAILIVRAINGIVEALFGIDMLALGREWIGALADGIAERWRALTAWLSEAVSGLVDWMPDWVKDRLGIEVTARTLSDDEIDRQAAATARRQVAGAGPNPTMGYGEAFERERERLRAENDRIRANAAGQVSVPEMPAMTDAGVSVGPDLSRYWVEAPTITAPTVSATAPGSPAPSSTASSSTAPDSTTGRSAPVAPAAPVLAPIDIPVITPAIDIDAAAPAMADLTDLSASLTDMEAGLTDVEGRLAELDRTPTDLSEGTITGVADALQQPPPDVSIAVSAGAVVINVGHGDPEAIRAAVDQGLRRTVTAAGREARASLYD